MSSTDLYIGLISGTSVDGVDCVLVEFKNDQPTIVATHFKPAPAELRASTLQLCAGEKIDLASLGNLDIQIAQFFSEAVNELLSQSSIKATQIAAIGSHGQTVWHQPEGEFPFTLQIGDANTIAFLTGIDTVADFRRMDMAAGGQGAPLAPLLHRNVFQHQKFDRAVVNIGGISNITCLPAHGACLAFDTGPGNVLMDYWIDKHQGKRFDDNGEWAATGTVNAKLLSLLLDEGYFELEHPKSTGRELFNGAWLEKKLSQHSSVPNADVQATLIQLTAITIASQITKLMTPSALYVCGGGAHNSVLMSALKEQLQSASVESTQALGMDPDWVEAIAFAWMAKERIANRTIDTSAFTGASKPVLLGGVYSAGN